MVNSRLCDDLEIINTTDWRKAMIVRSVRKHSSIKLDWIAKELHMGVRSRVARAEQMLKVRLKNEKARIAPMKDDTQEVKSKKSTLPSSKKY